MARVSGLRDGWLLGLAAITIGGWALPVAAADLSGDCCADLDERIAELEATTARKGNRKVSLTVSGWVNEEIVWWDDGSEKNVYVGTSPVEQSRFKFAGSAKIAADWSAGYTIEIGVFGGNGGKWDQFTPDGTSGANGVVVRKSSWNLQSKTYGKVTVGQDATATYHLLDDADTTLTRSFYDGEGAPDYQSGFFVRDRTGNFISSGGSNLKWSDVLRGFNNSTPGDNGRRNIVRYDSPEFAGFSVATAWGEDDIWDIAAIYEGGFGDFEVNARAGYGHSSDEKSTVCHSGPAGFTADCEWWGVSGLIQHKPTGIYVFSGYGEQIDHTRAADAGVNAGLVDKSDQIWYVQTGIEKKWLSLGKTNFFGEYRHDTPGSNVTGGTLRTQSADIHFWAGGMAQYFDSAETMLYLVYQHADGDALVGTGAASTKLNSLQQVVVGAKVNF